MKGMKSIQNLVRTNMSRLCELIPPDGSALMQPALQVCGKRLSWPDEERELNNHVHLFPSAHTFFFSFIFLGDPRNQSGFAVGRQAKASPESSGDGRGSRWNRPCLPFSFHVLRLRPVEWKPASAVPYVDGNA